MKCTVLVAVLLTAAVLTPATPAAAAQNCGVELASHQGFGTGRDANTLGAFRAAARLQARWIETDLFQTRNRVPLLIHQDNLFASTRKHGFVSELTSYQIRRGYRTIDGSVIPKFGEGLRAVKAHRGVKMLVEIKRFQSLGPHCTLDHRQRDATPRLDLLHVRLPAQVAAPRLPRYPDRVEGAAWR